MMKTLYFSYKIMKSTTKNYGREAAENALY